MKQVTGTRLSAENPEARAQTTVSTDRKRKAPFLRIQNLITLRSVYNKRFCASDKS